MAADIAWSALLLQGYASMNYFLRSTNVRESNTGFSLWTCLRPLFFRVGWMLSLPLYVGKLLVTAWTRLRSSGWSERNSCFFFDSLLRILLCYTF